MVADLGTQVPHRIYLRRLGWLVLILVALSSEFVAAQDTTDDGDQFSDETKGAISASGSNLTLEFLQSLGKGRCAQQMGNDNFYAACSQKKDPVACLSRSKDCVWKLMNDTDNYECACSFQECKCGNPGENATASEDYDPGTMGLVMIPSMLACGCSSMAFVAYRMREQLARFLPLILPDWFLAKVAIKDDEGGKKDKAQIKEDRTTQVFLALSSLLSSLIVFFKLCLSRNMQVCHVTVHHRFLRVSGTQACGQLVLV